VVSALTLHLHAPQQGKLLFLQLHHCEEHPFVQPQEMSSAQLSGTAGNDISVEIILPSQSVQPSSIAEGRSRSLHTACLHTMAW